MAQLKQDKRVGVLTTPLGKDVLVLVRFDGNEGLSELFEFRIEAASEEAEARRRARPACQQIDCDRQATR